MSTYLKNLYPPDDASHVGFKHSDWLKNLAQPTRLLKISIVKMYPKLSFKDLGNISLVSAILVIAQMCGVEFSANHFHFIDFTPNLSKAF